MPRAAAAGGLGIVLCLLVATSGVAASEPPRFVRASSPPGRSEANKSSFTPAISADGRWVAFASEASNLVPGDTNNHRDVFLRDLETGRITRVSVGSRGEQGNGDSWRVLVAVGRRPVRGLRLVVASNLLDGDGDGDDNGKGDVFLHDRDTATTTMISRGFDAHAGDGQSGFATISADGSTVAFESTAHNLIAGVDAPLSQVLTWDRRSGTFELISRGWAGDAVGGGSGGVSISADGRYVAFASASDAMVPNDYNQARDVFVRDRRLGLTTRVSVNSVGGEGNARSDGPSISADGRYVAFESTSSNLLGLNPAAQDVPKVPREADPGGLLEGGDHNIASDLFVHDMLTGRTTRVSVASDGTEAVGESYNGVISGDGRWVAFVSDAANLVPGDTNSFREVFLHDNLTGAHDLESAPAWAVLSATSRAPHPAIDRVGKPDRVRLRGRKYGVRRPQSPGERHFRPLHRPGRELTVTAAELVCRFATPMRSCDPVIRAEAGLPGLISRSCPTGQLRASSWPNRRCQPAMSPGRCSEGRSRAAASAWANELYAWMTHPPRSSETLSRPGEVAAGSHSSVSSTASISSASSTIR